MQQMAMQQAMMQPQMAMQQVPQQSMYQAPMMGQMNQMNQMAQMQMNQMNQMQSPWIMYYNQHGQPYYYNEQTGEQCWQLPPGATCSRQGGTYPMQGVQGGFNNMGQMWQGQQQMQQMPYGYQQQQSWYWESFQWLFDLFSVPCCRLVASTWPWQGCRRRFGQESVRGFLGTWRVKS